MKGPPRIIIEELSARTGIPRRTIERLRTYKYKYLDGVVFPNHDPIELKHVIACIVGLHLTYPKAVKLIALAGYMLNEETPEGRAYEKIIKYYNKFSVPACNDYLIRNHLPPLTNNADVLSPHDDLTQ